VEKVAHEIRTFGDPILKSRATPVNDFDDSLKQLAEDMMRLMYEAEGAGLAANQIGRLKRIFVVAYENEGELREFIVVNPMIEDRSETQEKDIEGCLSIPGIGVEVERPLAVILRGQDLSGAPLRVEAEGRLARIFQHEIDHLDGILMLDRTDRESRKNAMREMRERLLAGR
jgi:peptide deformylase